jgi:hypothetical protein
MSGGHDTQKRKIRKCCGRPLVGIICTFFKFKNVRASRSLHPSINNCPHIFYPCLQMPTALDDWTSEEVEGINL